MVAPETLAAFAALAFVVIVIPGPSVMFIIGRALQHGRRAALVSVIGNTGGEIVHTALVAAGVGALLAASPTAFEVLKWAGGLYLIYLGAQAWRHRGDGLTAGDPLATEARPGTGRLLWESFVVGVLNPKTLVFVAAVLPQFVDVERGPAWAQIVVLGLVFAVVAIVSDGAYGLVAGTARRWFADSPARVARLRGAGGVLIVLLGIAVLVTTRA